MVDRLVQPFFSFFYDRYLSFGDENREVNENLRISVKWCFDFAKNITFLGAIKFAAIKTGSTLLYVIYYSLAFLLGQYVYSYIEFLRMPPIDFGNPIERRRIWQRVSWSGVLIALLIAGSVNTLISHAIDSVVQSQQH